MAVVVVKKELERTPRPVVGSLRSGFHQIPRQKSTFMGPSKLREAPTSP